jgi:hypothetical protein
MANHNKNKRFGGDGMQPVRKAHATGQGALEREFRRKLERGPVRPLHNADEDVFLDLNNLSD